MAPSQMKAHFIEFMENMLSKGHAEVAPPLKQGQECWYLPLFGTYHPKKPNKIHVVFDSSASYEGVSLNEVLFRAPDLNNSLLGVLMRFRKKQVAITADIEHMFNCFVVKEDHRDFLRFLVVQKQWPHLRHSGLQTVRPPLWEQSLPCCGSFQGCRGPRPLFWWATHST